VEPLSSSAAPTSAHRLGVTGDAGFIVVSSLAKITLAVAVIGTAGYDAISMTSAHLQVQDHAQQAAALGYEQLTLGRSDKAVRLAIFKYAQEVGDVVTASGIKIAKDRTVTVTLTHEARTIAASHIPTVKTYILATGTGSAGDPIR
jgi:hypothetical protein